MAPVFIDSERLGGLPGEVISSTGVAPRDLMVPILIRSTTESEADNLVEELTSIVRGGDCQIEVVTAGTRNTARVITARYISGLESVTQAHAVDTRMKLNLRFTAHDPYWTDAFASERTTPLNRLRNAYTNGINILNIDEPSTAEIWPTWTFTGVTENISAANLRTGQQWRFTEKLENIGDILEIRTDPRGETGAYLNGGRRIWKFDANSELWGLLPGRNPVLISGMNPADDSSLGAYSVRWVERFENC